MHTNHIQMPPDSTGKKIAINPMVILPVTSAAGFAEGDTIVGGTSNVTAIVKKVSTTDNHLYAKYTSSSQEGGSFTVGENVLVGGVIKSTVSAAQTLIYVNMNSIVSHDNPYFGQRVDAQGQAYVRYEEGAQILDAAGKTKTTAETVIGSYGFTSEDNWHEFMHREFVGTNSATVFDDFDNSYKLVTGTTSDGLTRMVSHKYHMHPKGTGLSISMLLNIGDTGKANVIREWGYFDNDNGIKFQLNGTDLKLIIKGTHAGGVIESIIPRADWNSDKLDGSGISRIDLDVSKVNRFWFDIHRGTRARAGIYGPDGNRIVCHVFRIANLQSQLAMAISTLPIQVKQYNTAISASTSETRFIEASVNIEGEMKKQTPYFESSGNVIANCTSAVWTPLISIKPVADAKHAIALLASTSVSAIVNGSPAVDGRVKVEIFKNATLTGATWATTKVGSFFVIDKDATAMTGGRAISEHMVKGTGNFDMDKFCSYLEENLLQNIDGTANTYTLAVKSINENTDCVGAINWEEYQI